MALLEEKLKNRRIILASQSPRRQYLMRALGIRFEVRQVQTDERYPSGMAIHEVPGYISRRKALAFPGGDLRANTLLITADTLVSLDGKILGKPSTREAAIETLEMLSGRDHNVITGVCLRSRAKIHTFSVDTRVYFRALREEEIHHYVDCYMPYDKAGSYGIQEWIGYVGIERINGSFYNVMGLPVTALYEELLRF